MPIDSAAVTNHRPAAPSSVSPEARQYLTLTGDISAQQLPEFAHSDIDAWTRVLSEQEKQVRTMFDSLQPPTGSFTRTEYDIAGVHTHSLRPATLPDTADDSEPLHIDIHGGGMVMCGGDLAWKMSTQRSVLQAGTTWAPDYRLPPQHPFPAALDDCLALYRSARAETGRADHCSRRVRRQQYRCRNAVAGQGF